MYSNRNNEDEFPAFDDEDVRRDFISKVCFILAIQIATTAGIVSMIIYVEPISEWFIENHWVMYVCLGCTFVIGIILGCCISVARLVPINFILLFAFTGLEGVVVGCISLRYNTKLILMAVGYTAILCTALLLFAMCAPCDFTGLGPFFLVAGLCLMFLAILGVFFIHSRILAWIICIGILFLSSLSLVHSIQSTVGGHRNQYSEEDYVIAALCIYIDIINIFVAILQILGLLDD